MSQQRKPSRYTLSRRSSICETASVGSTKSVKSNGSSEYNSSTSIGQLSANNHGSANNFKKLNGFRQSGSQESDDSNGIAYHPALNSTGSSQSSQQAPSILNVAEMLLHGVADHEILDIWLQSIQCDELLVKFIDSGYDMPTLSRITPQDLTAIGVTDPAKRLKILTEIKKLNLQDGLPSFKPTNLSQLLNLIRLDALYYKSLCDQRIDTVEKLCQLTWEDFEDLGITKLGHQKRFQLAIERVKELEALHGDNSSKPISEPIYDTNPSQILLVASTENHSMNGPIINKQQQQQQHHHQHQYQHHQATTLQNRQSMSQLPFSALANLPVHQQQLLQQSSIYATLSRQPSAKTKQPPPPVPIRTNSLKPYSIAETFGMPPPFGAPASYVSTSHHQTPSSGNHCNNITTGRDEDFPPPPSPLSVSDSDDLMSSNSESNSTEISHRSSLMTFQVGGT